MTETRKRPVGVALWLIVTGIIGWYAAFALTIEKFEKLENPDAIASCDFSPLVQCSTNLNSWQGSVFGFPNPLIGIAAWIAPIVVGFAILAGARFARWFWTFFWLGYVFAIGFVFWLAFQSIFALNVLCPWCMVTWVMVIPSFFVVTFHAMKQGVFGARAAATGERLMGWTPLMAVLVLAVIAVVAEMRLHVLATLF
jgi:uncharacterized membrane protein